VSVVAYRSVVSLLLGEESSNFDDGKSIFVGRRLLLVRAKIQDTGRTTDVACRLPVERGQYVDKRNPTRSKSRESRSELL
jgi:hypothetical protein